APERRAPPLASAHAWPETGVRRTGAGRTEADRAGRGQLARGDRSGDGCGAGDGGRQAGRRGPPVRRRPGRSACRPAERPAVPGVDPSTFRGYAAAATAASNPLWQGVADGGIAVSYTMGKLDRLSLGGQVTVAGQRRERLPVVAFGTVGIAGVDAVVSDAVA